MAERVASLALLVSLLLAGAAHAFVAPVAPCAGARAVGMATSLSAETPVGEATSPPEGMKPGMGLLDPIEEDEQFPNHGGRQPGVREHEVIDGRQTYVMTVGSTWDRMSKPKQHPRMLSHLDDMMKRKAGEGKGMQLDSEELAEVPERDYHMMSVFEPSQEEAEAAALGYYNCKTPGEWKAYVDYMGGVDKLKYGWEMEPPNVPGVIPKDVKWAPTTPEPSGDE